jgi:hypothetical protein
MDRRGDVRIGWELWKLIANKSTHTLPALLLALLEKVQPLGSESSQRQLRQMREKLQRQLTVRKL